MQGLTLQKGVLISLYTEIPLLEQKRRINGCILKKWTLEKKLKGSMEEITIPHRIHLLVISAN